MHVEYVPESSHTSYMPFFSLCTCHVDRLGEDVFLHAACSVVFLCEIRVTGRISESSGRQQHVHTWAEHMPEIIRDQPANSLSLYEVVLVVPGKKRARGCWQLIHAVWEGVREGSICCLTVWAGSSSLTVSSLSLHRWSPRVGSKHTWPLLSCPLHYGGLTEEG